MTRLRTALLLTLLSAGSAAAAEPLYLGSWDCEVATFTFTETTYSNGDTPMPIRKIEREDGNYHFFFDDDYSFWVSGLTKTSMQWLSDASGDSFSCTRVKD